MVLLTPWAALAAPADGPPESLGGGKYRVTVSSKIHTIDRIYRSMQGPTDNSDFQFGAEGSHELLWLTAFRVDVVDTDRNALTSQEYLCHSHLKFDPNVYDSKKHNARLENLTHQEEKMVTLIQGRTNVALPAGFGIPFYSDEPFEFHAMVINSKMPQRPFRIKTEAVFDYYKDREIKRPLKPLFRRSFSVTVPLEGEFKGPHCPIESGVDAGITPQIFEADAKAVETSQGLIFKNKEGKELSFHWYVPPGRHSYRSTMPLGLDLPFDTTVHHISIHLHPYGESLELRDLTTGKTIFKSRATNYRDRLGIANSTCYSSGRGIPVYKDHQYELVGTYNNRSSGDIDAMAVMYLYFFDKSFDDSKVQLTNAGE